MAKKENIFLFPLAFYNHLKRLTAYFILNFIKIIENANAIKIIVFPVHSDKDKIGNFFSGSPL